MRSIKFSYKNSLVPPREINQIGKKLLPYIQDIRKFLKTGSSGAQDKKYNRPEGSICLPFDSKQIQKISKLAKDYSSKKLGNIVVAGIGGSELGTSALWEALRGHCQSKMLFANTLDAQKTQRILTHVSQGYKQGRHTVLVIVSKSGTTTETIGNAAVLIRAIRRHEPKNWGKRIVAITDENSKLWQWAKRHSLTKFPIPKLVGGRYSFFSAVGMFPLAIAGINIYKLLEGARKITAECTTDNMKRNPSALSAIATYANYKQGKIIHDTFIFEPDLEAVGKWYRQLTGESIGKDGQGITPTISIGSMDLHSVAQLYLGGPADKVTTFISVAKQDRDFVIKCRPSVDELIPAISGTTFLQIMNATLLGTKTAYKKRGLPFMEVSIESIAEESLGALLQMKMIEMMYLGKLLDINAFDQPQVELYKEEVRKILKRLQT